MSRLNVYVYSTIQVQSISYGDLESSISKDFLNRMEDEFTKFGVSGRSLLFASGDSGTDCRGIVGTFRPMWPSSSPHVTAVGGTISLSEVWTDGGRRIFKNFRYSRLSKISC